MATPATARTSITASRISLFFPVFFLVVFGTLYGLSNALRKTDQTIPECSEIATRSECSRNSSCRWCQSPDLNDMCFEKSEALRLPSQVFSCQ